MTEILQKYDYLMTVIFHFSDKEVNHAVKYAKGKTKKSANRRFNIGLTTFE
ncbi:MAG: hypothetical protein ACI936_003806 [Paraglaciecola sp.]|jgi:hypothetical protein